MRRCNRSCCPFELATDFAGACGAGFGTKANAPFSPASDGFLSDLAGLSWSCFGEATRVWPISRLASICEPAGAKGEKYRNGEQIPNINDIHAHIR